MPERAVPARGDNGLARDMRQVGANDKVHRDARDKHQRPGNKAAADAKKTAEHSHDENDCREIQRIELYARNGKKHRGYNPSRSIKNVVTLSRKSPCTTIS